MNFMQITLGQYQEIYSINRSDIDDMDKIIQSMCVLTGMSEREVEELPIPEFNRIGKELAIINLEKFPEVKPPKYIRIGRQTYGWIHRPQDMQYYQYADIQAWIRGQAVLNQHKVIASLCYPVHRYGPIVMKGRNDPKKHPEIAEKLLECKFWIINAICVFFCKSWSVSIRALVDSLVKDTQMTPQQREEMRKLLLSASDGYIMQS